MDLHATLNAFYLHWRKGGECYVLVDPLGGADYQNDFGSKYSTARKKQIKDPLFEGQWDNAPTLVHVPADQYEIAESLLRRALAENGSFEVEGRSVCAFMFSHEPQEMLAANLKSCTDAAASGIGRFYFRFFDPRVLWHLPRVLTSTQLNRLKRRMDLWLYPHPLLGLVAFHEREEGASTTPVSEGQIRLDEEQWRAIDRIKVVNLALRRLQAAGDKLDESKGAALDAAILQAALQGIGDDREEDQADFAAAVIRHADAFLRHENFDGAMAAVKAGVPMHAALADVLRLS